MAIWDRIRQYSYWLDRHLTWAVKWIIVINVAVYLVEGLCFVPFAMDDRFLSLFAQNPILRFTQSESGATSVVINWWCPLQFFSYMFVHANFWHLFWNMLTLWFFGPPLEALWGRTGFFKFYLFTGFAAGALHGMLAPFVESGGYPMVGASGAIFGVLLAFALYYPKQQILLWFVLPMPSLYFVALIGLFTFLALLGGGGSHISHLTHLAGLGFGYAWLRLRDRFPAVWLVNEALIPFFHRSRRRASFGERFD